MSETGDELPTSDVAAPAERITPAQEAPDDSVRERLAKNRLEAFSDGVFAIAITLLVLELRLPDGLSHQALRNALGKLGPKLEAYALSFLIIGVYWVAHHLMLAAARYADRTLLWLNNLYLMVIAAIPFSAAVLGSYSREPLAATLYGLNLVAASLLMQLLWSYITHDYRLIDRAISPQLVRTGTLRTLTAIGLYLLAIPLAWIDTRISIAMYWLVPLAYIFLQALIDRRRRWSHAHVTALSEKDAPVGSADAKDSFS